MNPLDRGLTVLFAAAGVLAAAVSVAILAGWTTPGQYAVYISGMPGFRETAYALLAFAVLVGIRIIWLGISPQNGHAVVQEGPLGQVRISLSAIESLAEKLVLDLKGVREARAGVEEVDRGIGIRVKIVVATDVSIPHISSTIQNTIRERVLEVTGIEVRQVKIMVDNIAAQKLRVE